MGESQSEWQLPGAFFGSLRGAEGDAAISTDSPRGREQCPAQAKETDCVSSSRGAQRRSNMQVGSLQ